MKIVFLQKRPLFPANTGGKIRTLNVLRHLAQWHEVTYLCNCGPDEADAVAQTAALGMQVESFPWRETPRNSWKFPLEYALSLLSRYPYSVKKDYDPRLRARAAELAKSHDLLVCDFVQMARNAVGLPIPKLLFQHNVEAQIYERMAEENLSAAKRRCFRLEARRMHRFEGWAGNRFERVAAVSEQDRETFRTRYGWRHVDVIDTAVDTEHFCPRPATVRPREAVFVGSLDWLPNVLGMEWFVQEVWPLVRAELPDASCTFVGRNPTPQVTALARTPGIRLAASVPDVRPYLAEAALSIVPLRSGGGTRLKIFEAMAMGKAVLSTTLGAEGLPLTDGEHLSIRDTAEDFAVELCALLRDPARREAVAAAGAALVRRRFAGETVARQFEDICLRTVDAAHPEPVPAC